MYINLILIYPLLEVLEKAGSTGISDDDLMPMIVEQVKEVVNLALQVRESMISAL